MKKKVGKRLEVVLLLTVFCLLVAFAVSIAKLWREKAQKMTELKQISLKYSQQEKVNQKLRKQLSMGSQDEYIEEEAREKFNYAYPEEHIFVDTSGN